MKILEVERHGGEGAVIAAAGIRIEVVNAQIGKTVAGFGSHRTSCDTTSHEEQRQSEEKPGIRRHDVS